jgi:hypothetical protein
MTYVNTMHVLWLYERPVVHVVMHVIVLIVVWLLVVKHDKWI